MALAHSPKIVTDGLVMALDAANPKSYPGTGTTWFDISGNRNNATLSNVTHLSVNDGVFETAGNSSSFIDNSTINLSSSNFTVFCASRYTDTANTGRIVTAHNNNFLVGHWQNGTTGPAYPEAFFANGWVPNFSGSTSVSVDTNWRIYHACGNISADSYDFYVNDITKVSGSSGGANGPNGLSIGRTPLYSGSDYESAKGHCAFVYYYNKVLTKEETLQNFRAFRGRFGL